MATRDEPEHEIRIRMLGNSEVFVTCKCMDLVRRGWANKSRWGRLPRRDRVRGASDWKSFGDFPVGTPTEQLVAAYLVHLEDPSDRPEPPVQASPQAVAP